MDQDQLIEEVKWLINQYESQRKQLRSRAESWQFADQRQKSEFLKSTDMELCADGYVKIRDLILGKK